MRLIDQRLGLIFCFFALLFSVALARSFWLQGVRGGELRADARSQQVTTVEVPGERGRVIDRNGKVLAVSEDAATVVATPYQVKDPAAHRPAPLPGAAGDARRRSRTLSLTARRDSPTSRRRSTSTTPTRSRR